MKRIQQTPWTKCLWAAAGCVLILVGENSFISAAEEPEKPSPGTTAAERQIDHEHLQRIYKAISVYYKDHQDLPDWLSDLVPKYLPDANDLISPVEKRTGKSVLYGREDPKLHTSYIYEFNAGPAAEEFNRGRVVPLTCKQWKLMQLSKFGLITPILRCHLQNPVLNVAYSGEIYETGLLWENDPRAAALIKSKPSLGPHFDTQSGSHIDVRVVDAETGLAVSSVFVKSTLGSEFGILPPAEGQTDTNGVVPIIIGDWKIHFVALSATHSLYQSARFDWNHEVSPDGGVPSLITIKMMRSP